MPSRVPISSAVRDGAEEAGQSVPPARPDQRSPRRVCRGASHLAQLPSETPFPLAPRLQTGNSIDVSLGLSAEKSPRAPPDPRVPRTAPDSESQSLCYTGSHHSSSSRLGEAKD